MEKREQVRSSHADEKAVLSGAVLELPRKAGDRIEKGVVVLNGCDTACRLVPELKAYFYIVERRGWFGKSVEETSDIKLVDDLETLRETQKRFPTSICLPFANADFVDTDEFRPLGIPKPFTGIQIAAWQKFKRHDLFVKAAKLLPGQRFITFGHFWDGCRASSEVVTEQDLRTETLDLAEAIGAHNIDFAFADAQADADLPTSSTDINVFINMAEMGILTTRGEGVNRFKMECLAADIPVLVPSDTYETTKKHINRHTGVLYPPTPEGLAEAISFVKSHRRQFSPRKYLLRHSGIHMALAELKKSLCRLAKRDGSTQRFEDITWDGRNQSLTWGDEACIAMLRSAIQNASSSREHPSLS